MNSPLAFAIQLILMMCYNIIIEIVGNDECDKGRGWKIHLILN